MFCQPPGRENTVSKYLFNISGLIAGLVSRVDSGSVVATIRSEGILDNKSM